MCFIILFLDATIIDYDQSVVMSDAEESLFVSSCDYPLQYYGLSYCNYSIVDVTECPRLAVRCVAGKDIDQYNIIHHTYYVQNCKYTVHTDVHVYK